jgi:DNA repair protein RecN (Recombination protein N)
MLQELTIRNFALIEELRLSFPPGLNLITGETGAGKSIVIDAIGLALGERASGQDAIRAGADRCLVEAVFDLFDAPESTRRYLRENELEADDETALIVSRELTRAGKNQCRVNGRLMPVSSLRDATDGLIDVHGQHEHQTLLASDRHLDLLDNWLGAEALSQRDRIARLHADALSLRSDLASLRESARDRARNLDLYRFQRDEIHAAELTVTEEESLEAERTRLVNAEKLRACADEAYTALADSALDALNRAAAATIRASGFDPLVEPIRDQINEALAFADDARRALRNYRDEIESDSARLEQIDERIAAIHALKRKYGDSIEAILAYALDIEHKLDTIENSVEHEERIERQVAAVTMELATAARELSELRRSGSARFSAGIRSELRDLGMTACEFEARIDVQEIGARGSDKVEFLISPNPGEPLKPLAKIASGGELSRIMLALKTVLSRTAYVPTLIFDEIDIGVGGRTASTIGSKIASLSESAQVFCITHLPQIAALPAAAHFLIEKTVDGGRTVVRISELDSDSRVHEIARMLAGANQTETVMRHAREMLQTASAAMAQPDPPHETERISR